MAIKLKDNINDKKEVNPDSGNIVKEDNNIVVEDGNTKKKFPWAGLLIGFSIACLLIMIFYALSPIATVFITLVGYVIVFLYAIFAVVIPVLGTIFIILISDKYRGFLETAFDWADPILNADGSTDFLNFISNSYIYVLIAGSVIVGAALIFTIVNKILDKNKDSDKKGCMIAMIIIASLYAITAFLAGVLSL